ncbi:major facilitator superfamily domain-containing protein [Aspergillus pseudocaelatus]|uniref:Major facilitator superfamily domain-containing protein n=1 Tax=Aspergillus pseudocaelatus TaxID=1825620 RepID=A0ABQ6WIY3_9EURO|nr:major facilitator superfamily domain-containing protein [Aspergillus pseudocaelatus]
MSIGYTLTSAGTIILDGDQSVSPELSTAFDLIPKGGCPFLILLGWESPRWYARQGYWDKAFESLRRLRTSDILAARDLYHIHTWYKEKEAAFEQQHSTFSKCSSRLLVDPHMRRATLASVSVMVAGSLAGTGLTTAALVHVAYACRLTMRFCVLIVPITTLVFVVTKAGLPRLPRRQLYLASLFFIFCISFALCFIPPLAFQLPTLILLCISSVISVVGLGLVSFLYAAEVFPPSHRDVGVALSICIYQICQILVAAFIFLVWGKIDFHILTWVLTVVNLLSLLAVYLFMRESKQYTLEEMQSTFKMSTREFIVYRLRTDFINPFQRYVLRRRVRVQPVEAQGIASYSVPYTDEEAVSLASQP